MQMKWNRKSSSKKAAVTFHTLLIKVVRVYEYFFFLKKEVRFESKQLHLLTTLNGEIRA